MFVVELLTHPHTELFDEALRAETVQRQRREHPVEDLGGVEIGLDRLADTRVLHLDRDVVTVLRARPVHLADARRGVGRSVHSAKTRSGGPPRSSATTAAARLGAIGSASACNAASALGLVGETLRDVADELADLHQHALHVAELASDVLGAADRELRAEFGAPLLRGRQSDGSAWRRSGTCCAPSDATRASPASCACQRVPTRAP
ncbi:MAG: hypothetical protein WKF58_02660 [Ilumatobacteraceae bacterium]